MSPATYWLGRVGAAFIVVALITLCAALWLQENPLRRGLVRQQLRLQRDLEFLQSKLSARGVLYAQVVGLIGVIGLSGAKAPFAASLLAVLLFCPPLVITRRRLRRVQLIEEQVEPWLTVLANALHANPSLGEAIASTASLLREPIASELELIVKEHQLGSSLERALTQAAQRIGGNTFKAAVTILKTARRTGGNLPETLSTVVANLREMARLEGVVRTKTAEGKTQAFIISVVPLPLYLGIRLLSPQFFTPLETTFIGHLIFGVAALLWLSAFMLARRFVAVDV